MATSTIQDRPWFDSQREQKGKEYLHELKRNLSSAAVFLYFYPFFALFATAFLIDYPIGLAAEFLLYWFIWFALLHRRYAVDMEYKQLSIKFVSYLLRSPVSISYWKYSIFTNVSICFFILASYLTLTWYEGEILILTFLGLTYYLGYHLSWYGIASRHSIPLESELLAEKLNQAADRSGVKHYFPRVVDGKTFGVANAFCIGLIKPRMFVTDYLVENMSQNELLAVLLHELGHLKNRDILKRNLPPLVCFVTVGILTLVVGLGYAGYIPIPPLQTFMPTLIIIWVFLIFAGIFYPAMFLATRQEFRADRFSADNFNSDETISALASIRYLNLLPIYVKNVKKLNLLIRILRIEKYANTRRKE